MSDHIEKAISVPQMEWEKLTGQVQSLIGWRKSIMGGVVVIACLTGVVGWMAARSVERMDHLIAAYHESHTQFQVFQQEVRPFLQAGPQFTAAEHEIKSQRLALELKDWVRESYPPTWLRDQVMSHEKRIDHADEEQRAILNRLRDIEDKISESHR